MNQAYVMALLLLVLSSRGDPPAEHSHRSVCPATGHAASQCVPDFMRPELGPALERQLPDIGPWYPGYPAQAPPHVSHVQPRGFWPPRFQNAPSLDPSLEPQPGDLGR